MVAIPADMKWAVGSTLGRSPSPTYRDTQPFTSTDLFSNHPLDRGSRSPLRKTIETLAEPGFKPWTFLLRGNIANHYTTMLQKVIHYNSDNNDNQTLNTKGSKKEWQKNKKGWKRISQYVPLHCFLTEYTHCIQSDLWCRCIIGYCTHWDPYTMSRFQDISWSHSSIPHK